MREVNKIIQARFTKKTSFIDMDNGAYLHILIIYYLNNIEYVHKSVQGVADEKI